MINDLFYSQPELYEVAFPERGKADLCRSLFEQFLPSPPTSILDIGCGTARDLAALSNDYLYCAGFDVTPSMVAFARARFPSLSLEVGDMRSARLNRTFDVICALGGTINFAITDDDVANTLDTYRVHAHEGSLLLLQPLNSCDYFGGLNVPKVYTVPFDDSVAIGTATYDLCKLTQVIRRSRSWVVESDGREFADEVEYRIFSPAELRLLLENTGFEVLEVLQGPGSAVYSGSAVYLVASYKG